MLDESSEECKAALRQMSDELGELVSTGLDGDPEQPATDGVLLRFLRARKGDVTEACKQFRATCAWRKERDIARFRRGAQGPQGAAAAAAAAADPVLGTGGVELCPILRLMLPREEEGWWLFYSQTAAFGFDKSGRPIQLQQAARASARFADGFSYLLREGRCTPAEAKDRFVMMYVTFQEVQVARMAEASERLGRPVTQQVVIMDLQGLSALSLWPDRRAVDILREVIRITSTYYPETLACHFFINAPAAFTELWRAIRGYIDPTTREKMRILGKDYKAALLELIDPEQLPVEYGGTNPFNLFSAASSLEDAEQIVRRLREASDDLHSRKPAAGKRASQPGAPDCAFEHSYDTSPCKTFCECVLNPKKLDNDYAWG